MAGIGHNSKPRKDEIEASWKDETRADRITDNTPFDIQWQWEVWLSELTSSERLVAFAVRIYADKSGSSSRPSLATLEHMTRFSRNTIISCLAKLEKCGFLDKTKGAGRASNTYRLVIPGKTLRELAQVFDIRSGSIIEPLRDGAETRSSATNEPQERISTVAEALCGAAIEPQAAVQPVNHKAVVVQSDPRSGSTIAPDITDITKITTLNARASETANCFTAKAATVAFGLMAATIPVLPAAAVHVAPEPKTEAQQIENLSDKLFEVAGLAMASPASYPRLLIMAEARKWLGDGNTLQEILEVVGAVSAAAKPGTIKSWSYFTPAIADAKATRLAPMPQGTARAQRKLTWQEEETQARNRLLSMIDEE